MKRQILFVDDEPKVLDGLRRMLRPMRDEWDLTFAASAREALDAIDRAPFDVVVSDMRMPEMDGAALLDEVKQRCPAAVRLILSGYSDDEMAVRSVGPTHQFLAKPCDAETLKATVARACALHELLADEQLVAVVANIKSLPSVPLLYDQLHRMLGSPDASVDDIAGIISSDVGMVAKILQLVNSAFFGLRHHIESLPQAITYLGLDTVRAVVLTAGVFSEFEHTDTAQKAAEALYPHSMRVGALSREIARTSCHDRNLLEEALIAGLLHDVGKLVLAAELPETWAHACQSAREREMPLHEAERDLLGVTHAELGAYLLGLWGLRDPIVEAVAFHHAPSRCLTRAFAPLTPVHVANALVHETNADARDPQVSGADATYLEEVGVAHRVPDWRELSRSALMEKKKHAGANN